MKTVDIQTLSPRVSPEQVTAGAEGFIQIRPAEYRAAGVVHALTSDVDLLASLQDRHLQSGQIDAVGCHLVSNVRIAGMMYPFKNNALIVDGTHLSMVTHDWVNRFPTHVPGAVLGRASHTLDGIVLPVGSPGHRTFGHWIIDFLPRVALARMVTGASFQYLKILLLDDTPDWAVELLRLLFDIGPKQIVWMRTFDEEFLLNKACIPSHAHSGNLLFHSFIRELYDAFPRIVRPPFRRLYIQRGSTTDNRMFARRNEMESLAAHSGYELVDPSAMSFAEQAQLFSDARIIVGEYGSALHNAVFSQPGCQVVVMNVPGVEQTRIAAAFGHEIFLVPGHELPNRENYWDLPITSLRQVLDLAQYTRLQPAAA